jgi:hypothetical protein
VKKKKAPTLKALKNKCWKVFSEYIRRKEADEGGTNYCFTCGQLKFWKRSCRLAISSVAEPMRSSSTRKLSNVQCLMCNVFLRGNYGKYTLKMIDLHGREKSGGVLVFEEPGCEVHASRHSKLSSSVTNKS